MFSFLSITKTINRKSFGKTALIALDITAGGKSGKSPRASESSAATKDDVRQGRFPRKFI